MKTGSRGVSKEWLDEIKINYIDTIEELPQGDGIFITGYDCDINDLEEIKRKKIPLIEAPCPWIRVLKKQILSGNPLTHRYVIMIDEDHMVHHCYQSAYPSDTVVVQADNYQQRLEKAAINKPVYLLVYAAHRYKDAEDLATYIHNRFPHKDHILDNYKKTVCHWVQQGLFEEIHEKGRNERLDHLWIVCNSRGDRSTKSIVRSAEELGIKPVIVAQEKDIPQYVSENVRVGVVTAPIPMPHKKRKAILHTIRRQFGGPIETVRIMYDYFTTMILDHPENRTVIEDRLEEVLEYVSEEAVFTCSSKNGLPVEGIYKGRYGIKTLIQKLLFSPIRITNIDDYKYGKEGNRVNVHVLLETECRSTRKSCKTETIHTWTVNEKNKITSLRTSCS